MSKALTNYISNIKGYNIETSEKTIVSNIETEPKQVQVINIIKTTKNINKPSIEVDISKEYKVTVKLYMTKSDSVNFTFHTTWNDGKAMPLRIMYGKIVSQTKNMYKMSLKGKITKTDICLKCGRTLTNEISKLYGLGPECGEHYYINPLTKEEFEKYKNSIKDKFDEIKWEGWIPKVSIISMEAVNG